MHRTQWLILAIGCGVAMLYLMIGAWQDIAFVSRGERLLRLGLMTGFAAAGGECFKRATRGSRGAPMPEPRSTGRA